MYTCKRFPGTIWSAEGIQVFGACETAVFTGWSVAMTLSQAGGEGSVSHAETKIASSDALLQLQDPLQHITLLCLHSPDYQHVLLLVAFKPLVLHHYLHEEALTNRRTLNLSNFTRHTSPPRPGKGANTYQCEDYESKKHDGSNTPPRRTE